MSSSVQSTGDIAVNKTGISPIMDVVLGTRLTGDPLENTSKRAPEIFTNIVISATKETPMVEISDRVH